MLLTTVLIVPEKTSCSAVRRGEQGRRTVVLGTGLPSEPRRRGWFEPTAVLPPWTAGSGNTELLWVASAASPDQHQRQGVGQGVSAASQCRVRLCVCVYVCARTHASSLDRLVRVIPADGLVELKKTGFIKLELGR